MCRLLFASSRDNFPIPPLLESIADIAQNSSEYQGHGWGCAWRTGNRWRQYHHIDPIWEHDFSLFDETSVLLVHARSAFRDEGIVIDNNMPFSDGDSVFIFNGELRGVRIKADGRIGAEKIYNYIRRFDKGDQLEALDRAVNIIKKRSSYIRAMNIIMSDGSQHSLSTSFSENPDYFQMFQKQSGTVTLVCSQPFANETDWVKIDNNRTQEI